MATGFGQVLPADGNFGESDLRALAIYTFLDVIHILAWKWKKIGRGILKKVISYKRINLKCFQTILSKILIQISTHQRKYSTCPFWVVSSEFPRSDLRSVRGVDSGCGRPTRVKILPTLLFFPPPKGHFKSFFLRHVKWKNKMFWKHFDVDEGRASETSSGWWGQFRWALPRGKDCVTFFFVHWLTRTMCPRGH